MSSDKNVELFFPYYVNQGRLLDIYAILNGGYSEYFEITTAINQNTSKGGKGDVNASAGFKLFNIGGKISGEIAKSDAFSNENKEKKVQTVTSILSIVKDVLFSKGYIKTITESKPGDFVCLPVNLTINSVKSLISEISDLLKLCDNMQKVGATVKGTGKKIDNFDKLSKEITKLFEGEEIVFECEDFAIIGNIFDSYLYQSVRTDIINTDMMCLAQVKRVFPNGTELMKNTIFTKIQDHSAKEQLIEAISNISNVSVFDFEATAISSIYDKPVYQLEIIALYQ